MPSGMPLPDSLPAPHLPIPGPRAETVMHSSAPPPHEADWDIFDDAFNEDADEPADAEGSETSSFGTSEGTLSGDDREDLDF